MLEDLLDADYNESALLVDGKPSRAVANTLHSLVRLGLVHGRLVHGRLGKAASDQPRSWRIAPAGVLLVAGRVGWRVGRRVDSRTGAHDGWQVEQALGDRVHAMLGQGGDPFASRRAFGSYASQILAAQALPALYRAHGPGRGTELERPTKTRGGGR